MAKKVRGVRDLLNGTSLNNRERPRNGEPVDDVLRRRPSRAKRNRRWEQRQAAVTVTYRGIPPSVKKAVTAIAMELGINVGEVARYFLEYGLEAYHAGTLVIPVHTVAAKKTAYPNE